MSRRSREIKEDPVAYLQRERKIAHDLETGRNRVQLDWVMFCLILINIALYTGVVLLLIAVWMMEIM